MIIQAEKFGSSISSALRVQSDAMRLRRRQLAEERAAETSVKIMLPLIFFIFPGVFVVLVGPAALSIVSSCSGPNECAENRIKSLGKSPLARSYGRFLGWRMAMFKQAIPIAYEIKPTRSRSIRPWIIAIFAAGVFLVPLAAEGAAICYAQWCELMGQSTDVRTPIIDSIGSGIQNARDLLAESIGPTLQRTIRDPTVALPVASVLIVCGDGDAAAVEQCAGEAGPVNRQRG